MCEKYLKARMEEAGLTVPKTHNLYALLALILPIEAIVEWPCPGSQRSKHVRSHIGILGSRLPVLMQEMQ